MKKIIAAVSVGVLLVAGQAVAAGQATQAARVGDRIGAPAGESSAFAGIPLIGLIAAAGILAATIAVVSSDDSESD